MKQTDYQIEKINRFILIQKELGMKQKDFAAKLGLTQSKVSLINNNKAGSNILNDIFFRLNFEFGISKEWWENGTGNIFDEKKTTSIPQKPQPLIENEPNVLNDDSIYLKNDVYWRGRYDQLKEDHERILKELEELRNK